MDKTHGGLTAAQIEGMTATEIMIRDKGLTAPRVTPADIEAAIEHTFFINGGQAARAYDQSVARESKDHMPVDLLTICVVTLRNGFTVVGKSACASPENYDRELGEKIALEDAKRQLWPLLGVILKQRLHEEGDALRQKISAERCGND